jgi:cobalt/nickel transport system permease protein
MTLAFNSPQARPSLLSAVDPRWKLAGFLALILATALAHSLLALGLAWLLLLLLLLLGRIPVGWFLGRLAPVAAILVLLAGPLPLLLTRTPPFLEWGWIRVSEPGLTLAATVLLRGLGVCGLVLVLVASTPLHVLFQAAHALRMPGLLIQLALLTLRYVGLLASEFRRLRRAARVRGFIPGASWHTYRTLGNLAGTLLVRGHERAQRVHRAMLARGFDGRFRSLHRFTTRFLDVLVWLCLTLAAVWIGVVSLS